MTAVALAVPTSFVAATAALTMVVPPLAVPVAFIDAALSDGSEVVLTADALAIGCAFVSAVEAITMVADTLAIPVTMQPASLANSGDPDVAPWWGLWMGLRLGL